MGRKTNSRKNNRRNGGGCGCGGMEMLGFPKTGGFLGLFGGDEPAMTPQRTMPSQPTQSSNLSVPSSNSGSLTPGTIGRRSSENSTITRRTAERQQNMKEKKNRIVSEIKILKSEVNRIKEQLSKMNTTFKVDKTDSSPGLFGGYRATKRNKKYLKMYKQGKSIGFTMRSSLKAKGLIPRANGTYKISNKYRG